MFDDNNRCLIRWDLLGSHIMDVTFGEASEYVLADLMFVQWPQSYTDIQKTSEIISVSKNSLAQT